MTLVDRASSERQTPVGLRCQRPEADERDS